MMAFFQVLTNKHFFGLYFGFTSLIIANNLSVKPITNNFVLSPSNKCVGSLIVKSIGSKNKLCDYYTI